MIARSPAEPVAMMLLVRVLDRVAQRGERRFALGLGQRGSGRRGGLAGQAARASISTRLAASPLTM